jgi:hypothetical protein
MVIENPLVNRNNGKKQYGWSIRCVKDIPEFVGGDADYQNNTNELTIFWSGSDEVSGISTYEYTLGTTSGGTDAIDWTSTGTSTADTVSNLSLSDGQIYYLSVRATDAAGNVSDVLTGDGITIDLTAPAGTTVSDGMGNDIAYTGAGSTLSGNWAAFTESVSGIAKYEYAIGTSSDATDLLDWTDNSTTTSITKTGLSLIGGTNYYMNVGHGCGWECINNSYQ